MGGAVTGRSPVGHSKAQFVERDRGRVQLQRHGQFILLNRRQLSHFLRMRPQHALLVTADRSRHLFFILEVEREVRGETPFLHHPQARPSPFKASVHRIEPWSSGVLESRRASAK